MLCNGDFCGDVERGTASIAISKSHQKGCNKASSPRKTQEFTAKAHLCKDRSCLAMEKGTPSLATLKSHAKACKMPSLPTINALSAPTVRYAAPDLTLPIWKRADTSYPASCSSYDQGQSVPSERDICVLRSVRCIPRRFAAHSKV